MTTKNGVVAMVLMAAVAGSVVSAAHRPVLLREVKSLRFMAGEYAASARSPGAQVPRLECAYNPLGDDRFLPRSVLCVNKGLDDHGSIIWKCDAELGKALAFDNLQVSCEGYSRPGDEYVTEGSCSLKYSLMLSPAGAYHRHEHRQPSQQQYQQQREGTVPPYYRTADTTDVRAVSVWTFSNVLILVLVGAIAVRCCLRCCTPSAAPRANANDNYDDAARQGSRGWALWAAFPLLAYLVGRRRASSTHAQQQQPSAPPKEEARRDAETGEGVSKRTGYADTSIR